MVSTVTSPKHLSAGRWPVASVRVETASHPETERARAGRGAEVRARRVEGKAELAPTAMAALLRMQEHGEADHVGERVREALGDVHPHRHDGHGHKKPKPHDPPPPPPTTEPPPVTPPPVVADDPAPAQFLSTVLESLHARPESQFPDAPFSRRNRKPAAAPAAAPTGLGAFYTPGAFTPAQAGAMRAVAQGQAGLALLQAAQMSAYGFAARGPNPLRISTFA